jgi:phage terminase large subunit-like protein
LKPLERASSIKLAESLVKLTNSQRSEIIAGLSEEELTALHYDWLIWARPEQRIPEGEWFVWLIQAGRGAGKTRTGAETIRQWQDAGYSRFAFIAATPADARDIMIEGESGILNISPPWNRPKYEPSKRRLTWNNGAIAIMFSGADPEALRGPQHDKAWADEIFAWQYPQQTWDMLIFGLRLGDNPQVIVTSTPKPTKLIKELRADTTTHVTIGTTYDNRANLAPSFMREITKKYEGTRLGRQELNAEILDDNPNALWKREDIDKSRVLALPQMKRIVVAVDPAVTSNEGSDETGIIVAGLGMDGDGYIIDDLTVKGTPQVWASAAIAGYYKHEADRIVAEDNQGGEMVEYTIHSIDPNVPYRGVHASRGKAVRAEPISALYEQGRVHHVGYFGNLEDQLCEWEQGMKSPDRLDSMVHALTDLMLGGSAAQTVICAAGSVGRKSPYR